MIHCCKIVKLDSKNKEGDVQNKDAIDWNSVDSFPLQQRQGDKQKKFSELYQMQMEE